MRHNRADLESAAIVAIIPDLLTIATSLIGALYSPRSGSGRITHNPEVAPKRGHFRLAHHRLRTRELDDPRADLGA
jgi:hypothetical protein